MPSRRRTGFTLIELLTVIAIIALLAAIAFPVFSRVQEGVRQSSCMSNMHDLYVAAGIYRQDNGEQWPTMLLGPAEASDGSYLVGGGGGAAVPASSIRRGFLFPNYVKAKGIKAFQCPNNPEKNLTRTVTAVMPASSPWSTVLPGQVPTYSSGVYDFRNLPAAYTDKQVVYYAADSYDISALTGADGKRMAVSGQPGFQVTYATDWTAARARGISSRQDAPNQLRYARSAPADKTVLAWCNYHVVNGGGDKSMVIFASGTAKKLAYKELVAKGWNVAN